MLNRSRARLELVPRVALVGRRRLHYVRSALTSSAAIASLAIGVGVVYVGVLAAVLGAAALVGVCCGATRLQRVRRCIDRQIARRDRARREEGRQRELNCAAASRQQQYDVLRDLTEHIERCDSLEAQRFELQDLLDYFVRLTVGHQRCTESLRFLDVGTHTGATPRADTSQCQRIAARRLRHRETCAIQLERIADEMDAADELIRLVAQRVACANLAPTIGSEIDTRLAELDEVDAALTQLSA